MKKLLCVLLALAMCLSLLSVGVLAEEPEAAPAEEAAPAPEISLGGAPEDAAEPEVEAAEEAAEDVPEAAEDIAEDIAEAEEAPDLNDLIESVRVDDIVRLDTDTFTGRWVDEEGNILPDTFEFTNVNPDHIVVIMKDGREFVGDPWDVYDLLRATYDFDFWLEWWDIEGWTLEDGPLSPGDHTVTFRAGNVYAEYTVTVIEDPIVSIDVSGITRLDTDLSGWTDYYDEALDDWVDPGYAWRIDCWPYDAEVTVETKDGQIYSGSVDEVYAALCSDYDCDFNIGWDSYETPDERWEPGEHFAEFWIGGVYTFYDVTVIEDPVASVEVAPITRLDTDLDWGFTTYYDPELDMEIDVGGPWRIDCWPRQGEVTVTLKDGRTIACPADELEEKLEEALGYRLLIWWDSDENPGDTWGPGDHTATFHVGGAEAEYAVTVLPSLTLKLSEDGKTAKVEGDWSGLYVRVALVLRQPSGITGLYVTQVPINKDGTIVAPAFYVPGLSVVGVNVALVRSIEDISSSTPQVVVSDFRYT